MYEAWLHLVLGQDRSRLRAAVGMARRRREVQGQSGTERVCDGSHHMLLHTEGYILAPVAMSRKHIHTHPCMYVTSRKQLLPHPHPYVLPFS